jgi:hypothetical protein
VQGQHPQGAVHPVRHIAGCAQPTFEQSSPPSLFAPPWPPPPPVPEPNDPPAPDVALDPTVTTTLPVPVPDATDVPPEVALVTPPPSETTERPAVGSDAPQAPAAKRRIGIQVHRKKAMKLLHPSPAAE